jgi:hypothetical protein
LKSLILIGLLTLSACASTPTSNSSNRTLAHLQEIGFGSVSALSNAWGAPASIHPWQVGSKKTTEWSYYNQDGSELANFSIDPDTNEIIENNISPK